MRSLIPMTIANVLDQTSLDDAYRTENLDRALGPAQRPSMKEFKNSNRASASNVRSTLRRFRLALS
jgi:hypothetical protein